MNLWRAILIVLCVTHAAGAAETPGIVCTATDGARTIRFAMATPNFTLEADQSIHPQLKPVFNAEWNGFLKITQPGTYRLILTDGKAVLGQQTLQADRGLLPVHLTASRKLGEAQQQLWWESQTFRAQPVPSYAFVFTNDLADTADVSRLERGRQAVEDFNCVACHHSDNKIFQGRAAPDLSAAGSRLKKEWVYAWLANPQHFRAAATMPVILKTDQERADVAAYLDTLKTPAPAAATAPENISGSALFGKLGCAGCHGEKGVPLAGEGSKYRDGVLSNYLLDPLACDPSGRMPSQTMTPPEAAALAAFLAQSKNAVFEAPVPLGDVARGRELVRNDGCADCHTVREAGAQMISRLTAPALADLHGAGGCIASAPDGKAPRFTYTDEQRDGLTVFLFSPDISPAPAQDVTRWITEFRCDACHVWHSPSVLEFGRNQAPPSLADAGNKLRRSWIESVMTTTNRVRPWIEARMPLYGAQNIAGFLDGFAEQAGAALGEGGIINNPRVDLADEGMHYLGTDDEGLSCITCHDFRGEPSHGDLRSPDLTGLDARLRTDWVQRWLFDPGRITPGTAMPDFFSSKPNWEAEKMVHRLLQALAMGPAMPDPPGWHQDPRAYQILVTQTPVVQRCLLPDVSARAIAVGLPGGVSYAFDAADCQLRYAWTGAFLDAKPTWTWRGGLPPRVLGRKFYVAPASPPVRAGQAPNAEPHFLGYDLTNGFPRFDYQIDGATVHLLTTFEAHTMLCAYEVANATAPVRFNGGPDAVVTSEPSAQHGADGSWQMPAAGVVRFTARIPIPEGARHN